MSSLPAHLGATALPLDLVLDQHMVDSPDRLLELLPAGVYVCDRDGAIVRWNHRATELWGRTPKLGDPSERFCGSYLLYRLDGGPLPHAACPMAEALRTGIAVHNQEVVVERPDGGRAVALVNIEVLKDSAGAIVGAINCFQDVTERRRVQAALSQRERKWYEMLQALPVAVYMTDAAGRITFYNEAAADLWGVRPEIGKSEFCGSWKLYWPDGTPLPHDECPMALALKAKRPNRGMEAVAERPDGTRVQFLPFPTPLLDENGVLIGGLNTLVDVSELRRGEEKGLRLASIVDSSHDAIVTKDLNGIITSWNESAEQLFGYTAEEVLGRPITILIPADRSDEEPAIIGRIVRGERVDHFETIRRRKDGSLVEISLTISPLRNAQGKVIGASKIARDITERRQAEEQKRLLLREMNHRVKNLFALASGLVSLSARSRGAQTTAEIIGALQRRLAALARAHELTLPDLTNGGAKADAPTTLGALLHTVFAPFVDGEDDNGLRVVVSGPEVPIGGSAMTSIALLLHEFATNAAKYGGLSSPTGSVQVNWTVTADEVVLIWRETGGSSLGREPEGNGFGDQLAQGMIAQLGAKMSREWLPEGLTIRLTAPLERLVM
jgi:PAS domain S-box-containing protein